MEIEIIKNRDRVVLEKQRTSIFKSSRTGVEVTRGPQAATTRRSIKGRWFGGMTSIQQFWWGHPNRDVLKVTMTSKERTSPTHQTWCSKGCWNRKPPLERTAGRLCPRWETWFPLESEGDRDHSGTSERTGKVLLMTNHRESGRRESHWWKYRDSRG